MSVRGHIVAGRDLLIFVFASIAVAVCSPLLTDDTAVVAFIVLLRRRVLAPGRGTSSSPSLL